MCFVTCLFFVQYCLRFPRAHFLDQLLGQSLRPAHLLGHPWGQRVPHSLQETLRQRLRPGQTYSLKAGCLASYSLQQRSSQQETKCLVWTVTQTRLAVPSTECIMYWNQISIKHSIYFSNIDLDSKPRLD